MRLVTVTFNPALDRLYTVPGFRTDGVFRPTSLEVHAGGKGINVARVWKTLGGDGVATGLLGGRNGDAIAERLADEAIEARFLTIAGESRLALAIFNPDNGDESILNELGPQVSTTEIEPLIDHIASLAAGAEFIALSGSAPPGVPAEIYGRIVEASRAAGVRCAVDASGENLINAAAARPFLLKPNREEAKALGAHIETWADAPDAAVAIREQYGVEIVVITGGADGAVIASTDGVWSAKSQRIDVVSTLGSGDSTLAGILWGLSRGDNCGDALTLGVACGAANAMTVGAGRLSSVRIEEMSGKIYGVKLS